MLKDQSWLCEWDKGADASLVMHTNEQVSGLPLWMEMTQFSPQLENYVIQLLVRWQWNEENNVPRIVKCDLPDFTDGIWGAAMHTKSKL